MRSHLVAGDRGLERAWLLSTFFGTYSNEIEALLKPVVIAEISRLPTVALESRLSKAGGRLGPATKRTRGSSGRAPHEPAQSALRAPHKPAQNALFA